MTFPDNLKYTKDHEWIRVEGDTGVVGISEYAQGELGDVVFVELPQIGRQVKQSESFGTIEAVKAVSDIYAPLTGEVLEVNSDLEKAPELVNKEPYGKGWMIKLKITNKVELNNLLDPKAYRSLIGK
jgi:glycine cleavage system H protein